MAIFKKRKKIIVAVIIAIFVLYLISWQVDFSKEKPNWGIIFSQFYAQEELRLDWKATYQAILDELNVQKLRLIAYWQYLEPEKGQFDFKDLDWQIEEAQKRNKEIILVIGYRVPHWPECHASAWVNDLTEAERKEAVKDYLSVVVNHYKSFSAIKIWQVENEPLLSLFGKCPKPDRDFLKEEIALVKSLDSQRKIMVTDSGELSLWLRTAGLSEWLGTTLYGVVWNNYVGWWKHLYPPLFFTARAFLVKKFFGVEQVIISELQAEPWVPAQTSITQWSFDQQTKDFSVKQLQRNLKFAQKTGIKDIYLWGVEWWYWRKIHGDESYWQFGKEVLK